MSRSTLLGSYGKTRSLWQSTGSVSSHGILANNAAKYSLCSFSTSSYALYPKSHLQSRPIVRSMRAQFSTLQSFQTVHLSKTHRYFSDGENVSTSSPAEMNLINILRKNFPSATDIAVQDISGGCGSMYEVYVVSPDFKGMRLVKQHRMVTEALKGEIKDMHGVRISTVPSNE